MSGILIIALEQTMLTVKFRYGINDFKCHSIFFFSISMGESNTVVSAYTMYRHLQQ